MSSPKEPAAAGRNEPPEPIDTALVRELADILNDTDLTQIEVERGDLRIRVAREIVNHVHATPAPVPAHPGAAAPAAAAAPAPVAEAAPAAPAAPKGDLVKSPMVGTVYMSAQPGAPAFVKVGDTVTEGQTLLIIEAMKTMNPIPSPRAGVVVELIAQDGQPVEFGEGLLVLE
ncbi:MAG TPA: acetyl-CoA carboxylase biotin carboxyl carrier protein [Caulobacteraceae bacterium]|jgi:acetyl-CoA carboxylase biotin carboxyl carrier protein|nr:acetyl-CoA carboxylase biotin carboxyl carrier protein [Caulobacteraceae bacterium]